MKPEIKNAFEHLEFSKDFEENTTKINERISAKKPDRD